MQNHRSSNAPEIGEASRPNASGIVNRSVAKVALALAVILAGDPAYALLPKEATGGGDFSENGVQFCNFSRVKIGKGEWLLTATHCLGKQSAKDLALFHGNALEASEIAEKFQRSAPIRLSEISDANLVGKNIYIPGHFEDSAGKTRYFFRLRGTVQRMENSRLFHIQIGSDAIEEAKKSLNRTQSVWKGLSGSPVLLASDDALVWVVSEANKNGERVYFSWPEDIRFLESRISSADRPSKGPARK